MASSISIHILLCLVCLFTIIHTIKSYRLYDLQNIQQIKPNHVQHRSVLWPKICVTVFQEANDYQDSEDGSHPWFQPIRKCYPFDIR